MPCSKMRKFESTCNVLLQIVLQPQLYNTSELFLLYDVDKVGGGGCTLESFTITGLGFSLLPFNEFSL